MTAIKVIPKESKNKKSKVIIPSQVHTRRGTSVLNDKRTVCTRSIF